MDSVSYKTRSISPAEIKREWLLVVDATDLVLGRMASQVARLIRGKHKTFYTPNIDCGDHVIVIHAEKVRLTGNKRDGKVHVYHTGYPGGQREVTSRRMLDRKAKNRATAFVTPQAPNQVWSMDFVHDSLWNGRSFRLLNILDDYNRQVLHVEEATSLPALRVIHVLEMLRDTYGTLPKAIRTATAPSSSAKSNLLNNGF
jgi:ribosomal protein L13